MIVREEQTQDIQEIHEVNTDAFGQPQEADIVDKLRHNCGDLLSLVAVVDNRVVGHILFSPAILETKKGTVDGIGLAPMAVLPKYQSKESAQN
jgi:putative acetyltransferase